MGVRLESILNVWRAEAFEGRQSQRKQLKKFLRSGWTIVHLPEYPALVKHVYEP